MDKNQVMWDWIQGYSGFGKLFFNFGDAEADSTTFIPNPSDYTVKTDILGNKVKHYDFAITAFRSFDTVPSSTENMQSYALLTAFQNWLDEQNRNRNFPDFGSNCEVTGVVNLQNMPTNSGQYSALAKYMIQARVAYTEFE